MQAHTDEEVSSLGNRNSDLGKPAQNVSIKGITVKEKSLPNTPLLMSICICGCKFRRFPEVCGQTIPPGTAPSPACGQRVWKNSFTDSQAIRARSVRRCLFLRKDPLRILGITNTKCRCGTQALHQKATQTNKGGMSDVYLDSGTYLKSFYSVIFAPSCVRVGMMGSHHKILHHKITWNNCTPVILNEKHKKL